MSSSSPPPPLPLLPRRWCDIDLPSLNRLNNLVATLVQLLGEENQRTDVTIYVTISSSSSSSSSKSKAFTISHVRLHHRRRRPVAAAVASPTSNNDEDHEDDDRKLIILPEFDESSSISSSSSSIRSTLRTFFRWFALLARTPYDYPTTDFELLPSKNVIRAYIDSSPVDSSSLSVERRLRRGGDISKNEAEDDDDDARPTAALKRQRDHDDDDECVAVTATIKCAREDGKDASTTSSSSASSVWTPIDFTDRCGGAVDNFVFVDGRGNVIDDMFRPASVAVDVTTATSEDSAARQRPLDLTVVRASPSPPSSSTTNMDDIVMTDEQKRVLAIVDRIWQRGSGGGGSGDDRRRIVIDGVAGSGKTFLLGVMLKRFPRVLYLVKKRNFVDATTKRFAGCDNLRARTIDAYLMNILDIRSLPAWLDMKEESGKRAELKRQLRRRRQYSSSSNNNNRSRRDAGNMDVDDELVFVDEYSLIENSLGELLNEALVGRFALLVGDCNQQPPIGEPEDQAVRTMLGYDNVCFMYENVRATDPRLLYRLTSFTARSGDSDRVVVSALSGLPREKIVDMGPFVRSLRAVSRYGTDADYSLLPRLIVSSNERVNYANWAIGYLAWSNCPICRRRGGGGGDGGVDGRIAADTTATTITTTVGKKCCLRYTRRVVATTTAATATAAASLRSVAAGATEAAKASSTDDAYADEHFVVCGMRYRIVHARSDWPIRVGTRVIVRAIASNDSVVVETDDRARYRLRMTLVKPYEYGSKWQSRRGDAAAASCEYSFYMFPFVMDAATTVYQVQGLTLNEDEFPNCYVDVYGMNEKALYVTLSRFRHEYQLKGVINCQLLND